MLEKSKTLARQATRPDPAVWEVGRDDTTIFWKHKAEPHPDYEPQ